MFIISHTTSKKCSETELSDQKNEDGDFRPLKITFGSRSLSNKILYSIYKFFRTFYVSVFYYFLPFSSFIMSTLIPLYYRTFVTTEMPACNAN